MLTIDDTMRCDDDQIIVIIDIKQADESSDFFMSLERNNSASSASCKTIVLNTASLTKTIVGNCKKCCIETLGRYH